MATLKQKKVAKLIVENLTKDQPPSAGSMLKSVGYGTALQDQPGRVINSIGVKEELKHYGFDPETAKMVVGQIMMDGENDSVKLKAADMIFKVGGTYAAEKHVNLNLDVEPNNHIKELAEKLRQTSYGTPLLQEGE